MGVALLITLGHGTLSAEDLAGLLRGAGVERLVDIRSFPGSRANPQMARERMQEWLPAKGIGYFWEQRLGGRRRLPRDTEPVDTWWQVRAFAAYAAWTRSADWQEAFAGLVEAAGGTTIAICCSEAVWWRCHRRLVADVAALTTDLDVRHLMHDGKLREHPVAEGAVVREGHVYWTE